MLKLPQSISYSATEYLMFCYGPLDVALRLGPKVPIFAQGPARILDVALCLGPKVPLEWAQAPTVSKLYAVIGGPD